ncbi:HAD family phosphatase [Aquimarina sp. ERC-38]|uniref:HAD family hydrolase n=1 Tax=Aquimarina sp. ERC-38 TaxID=2949996 RepID=UPI0022452FAD|nr:HAD family phosphatase [Aquimarina sp. ERC-38]UZO79358.1 HAD family phosphatase [Aquimarina sp. ERC-38]
MIKTLLFDFGDVFINLDKTATEREFLKLGNADNYQQIHSLAESYEVGKMSTSEFYEAMGQLFPEATSDQISTAWNAILKDFPLYRLEFLKQLAAIKEYKLILLSNTNEAHINWVKKKVPYFEEFKSYFDVFYLSYEIHLRKPDTAIYKYVLDQQDLKATEVLFIDDTKENTDVAKKLGIQTWNLRPGTDDIIDLFKVKTTLR